MTFCMGRVGFGGVLALAAVGMTGCRSLPPSKAEALFTPEEARGAAVFQNYCARCHYPTTAKGLCGPGLQAITKVKSLPSGAPPTDDRLMSTIRNGHGLMQPVPVSDEDMPDLLAYLHTL